MKYSQAAGAWEYFRDTESGDTILILNDSSEGSTQQYRKYDVWQFVNAYDSNGNYQGKTVRSILKFPYDMIEQNAADIAALRETASAAIVDVVELPTEDINEDVFYRLLTGTFVSL